MKYYIVEDLIQGLLNPGSLVPDVNYLRYNPKTKEVIDIRKLPQPYTFYIDEKGIKHIIQAEPSWQPLDCTWYDELVFDTTTNQWRVKTADEKLAELKEEKQKQLLQLEKSRLQKVLDKYGYNGLADVQLYASQNDSEAQNILNWYQKYDDLIWQYIDNDLATFTSVDELLAIDMKNIEEQIYQQSIEQNPLPSQG
ncbi:hypothetical protein SAMN06265182_2130 [Persephonella hydrogeniphila]|uniref:DUF4376 domain-containing protein n=1 Tax=Persephonella hydrogeniphila TaxID=198703 RepID=A0A285NVH9_9AQUI|nr:hypothetical protein [Persephonella hydrogeniphila]SNZ11886.1 hypothetical protein SAMN06265182_2130 [Persephonella hydrogeniphila]